MTKRKTKPASDTYERFMAHWHAERAAGRDPSGLTPLGWFDAGWTQCVKAAEAERAQGKALREALEPFRRIADKYDELDASADDGEATADAWGALVRLGDCRKARAALAAEAEATP